MSYIDIMSQNSYGSYNRKLARLTNINVAVYWAELLNIASDCIKNNTFNSEGYFKIDRNLIFTQTTISIETQHECDTILFKLEVLDTHPTEADLIGIHCDKMSSLLINSDQDQLKTISKVVKISAVDKKEGKRQGILYRLKESLDISNKTLYDSYCNWIDVAYDKGICKAAQVDIFKKTIDKYSMDENIQLEILKICILNSYRDATWGINKYEQQHNIKSSPSRLGGQKIATTESIKTDVAF